MKKITTLFGAAAAACGLTLSGAYAQETDRPQPNPPVQETADDVEATEPREQPGVLTPDADADKAERQIVEGRLYRVDDLVDAKIRNPQGEDLGEVEEMVVDVNSGDIRYAVVSYGGFLDLGDKLFAVPLKAMTLKQNEDGEPFFVVDIDQQRLENAQGFDEDNWPNFADRSFTTAVDETYGIEAGQQASGQQAALYKLSTFEGVNVRGRDAAQEIGEVEWIVVDPQKAKVSHLAMDLEDEFEAERNDDAVVLVPMGQFELKTQNDDTFLQVNADVKKIRSAPVVTEEQFKDAASHKDLRQKVDGHFGAAGDTQDRPATETAPE